MYDIKKSIVNKYRGLPLDFLFGAYQEHFGYVYDDPEIKEMFLSFMEEIMETGEMKLASRGVFLEGSIKEQIDLFRQAWPKKYDENIPEYDIDNLWWLLYAPAGAVWFWEDGYVEWT